MTYEVPQPILNSPYDEPRALGCQQIAVKVIDDRGNELLVVKKLSEAEK